VQSQTALHPVSELLMVEPADFSEQDTFLGGAEILNNTVPNTSGNGRPSTVNVLLQFCDPVCVAISEGTRYVEVST
jgi:hypothetical protein